MAKQNKNVSKYTDAWNSEQFARECKDKARWIPEWKSWILWRDMGLWGEDESGEILDIAIKVVRGWEEIREHLDEKEAAVLGNWIIRCQDKGKLEAMVSLARGRMITRAEELDSNLWLLNCKNGVWDLKNDKLLEYAPKYLMTKMCKLNVKEEAKCEKWIAFLENAMAGNKELLEYLQRVVGSGLCGDVLDKVVYFANGGKDTGKTTFVTTLQKILGEYSAQVNYTDFMEDKWGNTHRTQPELEVVEGKRLIISSEGEQGQRLSIAKMKQLTGMGYVAVNPKYKKQYQFIPQATFIFDTNYFPEVDGTDDTIFNRIKILPFEVNIPKEKQDRKLKYKLLEEAEGILWWMIEGCKKWREEGLGSEPEKVKLAVKEKQREGDPIGQWLDVDCKGTEGSEKTTTICQERYNNWAKDAGQVKIESPKTFKRKMERPKRFLNGLEIERVSRLFNQNSGGYKNIDFKDEFDGNEPSEGQEELREIHQREKQGKFSFEKLVDEDNLDENFI